MAPVSSDFRDPGPAAASVEAHGKGCQVQRCDPLPSREGRLLTLCLWAESYSPGGETSLLSTESSEWHVAYVFY